MRIAGGQDHAKPVLFRPSALGYADRYDVISMIAALEETLKDLGQDIHYGQGVAKAISLLNQ